MTGEPNAIIKRLREISGQLIDPDVAIAIFEQLPDAIIVVNSEASIQLVNRQAEFMFGYYRKELFDQPIEVLIPNDAKESHVKHRNAFMHDPRARPMAASREFNLRGLRKDGSEFSAEINLSPMTTYLGLLVMAVIRKKRE